MSMQTKQVPTPGAIRGTIQIAALSILALGLFISLQAVASAGEKGFSFTYAPAKGDNIQINMNPYSLGKYLTESQVNRPEILNEVKAQLEKGGYYRKRTKDQKTRPTILTVYVDKDYMLHIVTNRSDTCDECKGTGTRTSPFGKLTGKVAVSFRCQKCKGSGVLENNTTEKFYILSAEDFADPKVGRKVMADRAYSHAPSGAEAWVERLTSKNPRERLQACEWLDENYVREGMFFQDIMPMLKKARFYDSNEKRRLMVWQFWAAKDLPDERDRAYYRIYADTKSGKITRKGFYSGD